MRRRRVQGRSLQVRRVPLHVHEHAPAYARTCPCMCMSMPLHVHMHAPAYACAYHCISLHMHITAYVCHCICMSLHMYVTAYAHHHICVCTSLHMHLHIAACAYAYAGAAYAANLLSERAHTMESYMRQATSTQPAAAASFPHATLPAASEEASFTVNVIHTSPPAASDASSPGHTSAAAQRVHGSGCSGCSGWAATAPQQPAGGDGGAADGGAAVGGGAVGGGAVGGAAVGGGDGGLSKEVGDPVGALRGIGSLLQVSTAQCCLYMCAYDVAGRPHAHAHTRAALARCCR